MRSPRAKLISSATITLVAVGFCALPGCSDSPPPSPGPKQPIAAVPVPREEPSVATVNGKRITREQLVQPLIDTYGLNLLLNMIQLELARQNAQKAGVKVTPGDVDRERQLILKGAFPEADPKDYEQLLTQLLKQQNITPVQWEMLLNTNATLRKMAEPMCVGKITEDNIQQAFDIKYGAQAKIRDIQISNIKEAQEVKQKLAAGQSFEDVAKAMSQDPHTAPLGGEWPAFTFNAPSVSDLIKEQAFGLKVGEVSDPLNTGNAYHVIKVEKRIAPVIAKLDRHTHDYLRDALMEKLVQEYVKALRNQLALQTTQSSITQITEPSLRKQFDQKVAEHEAALKEEEKARQLQMLRRAVSSTGPSTRAAGERPPATKSGAAPQPAATDGKP